MNKEVIIKKIAYHPSGKWEDGELKIIAQTKIGKLKFVYRGEEAEVFINDKKLKGSFFNYFDYPDFGEPSLIARSGSSDRANKRFMKSIKKEAKKVIKEWISLAEKEGDFAEGRR